MKIELNNNDWLNICILLYSLFIFGIGFIFGRFT
jgi:hypothetical protein